MLRISDGAAADLVTLALLERSMLGSAREMKMHVINDNRVCKTQSGGNSEQRVAMERGTGLLEQETFALENSMPIESLVVAARANSWLNLNKKT